MTWTTRHSKEIPEITSDSELEGESEDEVVSAEELQSEPYVHLLIGLNITESFLLR